MHSRFAGGGSAAATIATPSFHPRFCLSVRSGLAGTRSNVLSMRSCQHAATTAISLDFQYGSNGDDSRQNTDAAISSGRGVLDDAASPGCGSLVFFTHAAMEGLRSGGRIGNTMPARRDCGSGLRSKADQLFYPLRSVRSCLLGAGFHSVSRRHL